MDIIVQDAKTLAIFQQTRPTRPPAPTAGAVLNWQVEPVETLSKRQLFPCGCVLQRFGTNPSHFWLGFFLDIPYALDVFEVYILCPECGIMCADSGQDDAVGHCQFQVN